MDGARGPFAANPAGQAKKAGVKPKKKNPHRENISFFFFLATTNIYCYRKEEMNEFMAVNHNLIMHIPGFSSFTAVSRVQSMYIKQVLVDFKITMSHRCNDRS